MLSKKEDENFCFICYELKVKREKTPKKLKNQKFYIKTCDCDGIVHNICLKIWYEQSRRCPICRDIMIDKNVFVDVFVDVNENENIILNENRFLNENIGLRMRAYCYIQKKWRKFVTFINMIGMIYIIYYFYITITTKVR